MRLIVLLLVTANAYPSWFHEYKETHAKVYTNDEELRAFSVLEPKYDFAKVHHLQFNLSFGCKPHQRTTFKSFP